MDNIISAENRFFRSLVAPSDIGKTCLIHEWLKVGTLQPKFDKNYFFYQNLQRVFDVMQKQVDNLDFVQGVNFDFINFSRNKGPKYYLIFHDSCAEICNAKEIVDISTAGRHRGFSTIYNKYDLFHQSKFGRDVELQNTNIVLFKSPRDVHQVASLSVQLGLRSALADWYRDATSVLFGHFLIDLSPRTDGRLRYCTNSGKNQSKFYVPKKLKHLKYLDDKHIKSLYSPSSATTFPRKQKKVSENVSQRSHPIYQRVHRQPAARKFVGSGKKSRAKVQSQIRELSLKTKTWKQRKSLLSSPNGLLLMKKISPFVVNLLSSDGTV